jgi:chromosome segregation ATPase
MHLLGAKIKGFKSFADSFDLQFDAGVTAVIGPNGSGKSNLAEAIRWVLGEQSLKQLRGKASSDVIFAGSTKRQAGRKTSVELLFSNESGRFQVDSAQVQIGRRLTRDGDSEYTINGDTARLIDIQHLLSQAGLGTKSYTVISQGMVDQYVTASAGGRRELFEEATGVKALQLKMKEAQRKLEKAAQHIHELTLVKQELEPQLKVLEREAKRFSEKEGLKERYTNEQSHWLHTRFHELQADITQHQQVLGAATQEIEQAGRERHILEQMLFSAAQQGEADGLAPLRQALADAERTFALAQDRQAIQQRQREELTDKIRKARRAVEESRASLEREKADMAQFDWLKSARGALRQTEHFLVAWLNNEELSREQSEKLLQTIRRVLESGSDETTLESARSFLSRLEEPIAGLATHEALLKEYEHQLQSIEPVHAPSRTEIDELRTQIVTAEAQTQTDIDFGKLQLDLETARHTEAKGERVAGAAAQALEKSQTGLQELTQLILREKGSQFLEYVRSATPQSETPLQEEELGRLAAKVAALEEIDPLIVKEYEETLARYEHVSSELADALQTQTNITTLVNDLTLRIQEQFDTQLKLINVAFGQYFTRLFDGGSAVLAAADEGIEIAVQLPGKKTRYVHLLSGGERALTALALLFAILQAQKPPFLVLDEVDAALDEANADRFASLLQEMSQTTQCIVITHNRATMGYAHTLYGVTMSEPGVSKVYSLKLQQIHEAVGQSEAEVTM